MKYAHWDGIIWDIQTVDTNVLGAGWFWAPSTSIVLDSTNTPHISYTDNSLVQSLKYAYWTGDEWHTQRIDTGRSAICGESSLALNQDDQPRIACHDYAEGDLLYIRRGSQ